jgi:hypothetical protein
MRVVAWPLMLCFAALLPTLGGCRPSYSAKAITAHVIDAETKQPLEGVIVVAHWQLRGGGEGKGEVGQLMVLETVTDHTGTFHFPAWGPKKVPPPITMNALLQEQDPEILLFKDGYRFAHISNFDLRTESDYRKQSVRTSQYDGKTLEMDRIQGPQPVGWVEDMNLHLDPLDAYCAWRNVPLLIEAIRKQTEALRRAGNRTETFYDKLVNAESDELKEGCGSVRQFIQEHAG